MPQAFHLETGDDGLAALTLDSPGERVNLLTREVLEELRDVVEDLARRRDVGCLVLLSGKEDSFCHGAHVDLIEGLTEVADAVAGAEGGQAIISAWEKLPFPTISAIHATCMGGGTELSLACDYRVASDSPELRIGLPETRLGILPAWGGCVRLPRLIGLAEALGLILPGKSVTAHKALSLGLVDAVLPAAGFRRQVRAFAERILDPDAPDPGEHGDRDLRELLLEKNPLGRRIVFDQARKKTLVQGRSRYPAPARAVEVVRVGTEQGAEAGFAAEARALGELATGAVSKNLIHLFRLNQASKRPLVCAEEKPGEEGKPGKEVFPQGSVLSAAVVGAGVMGADLAQLAVLKGNARVRLHDGSREALLSGAGAVAEGVRNRIKRRRLAPWEARGLMARLQPAPKLDGLRGTAVVVEAVTEDLEVKRALFQHLARATGEEAVLASNTSSLSITELAAGNPAAGRIIGLHFFNPVARVPLVEVVRGKETTAETFARAVAFVRRLGKTPLAVEDRPGFLVNRLLGFYMTEALWLLADGVAPEAVDAVMVEWGFPVGPFALIDRVGIDVALTVAERLSESFSDRLVLPAWQWREAFLGPGKLGEKSGGGFYRYENRKRRTVDQERLRLLGAGQPRAEADPVKVADRLVLPMVNEAARCLQDGLVDGPGAIDLGLVMGAGFPPFRGGLCRWADGQGLSTLVEVLDRLSEAVAPRFAPSEALLAAADRGGFYR